MFDTMMVAKRIRQARIERNMTQTNLADAMGVSYQTVSNWERGNSMPDISKLTELCDVLGISLNKLLGTEDPAAQAAEKSVQQKELTVEELEQVAPMLPPMQMQEQVERQRSGKKLSLRNIVSLAPFLDEEYLDELLAEAQPENLEDVMALAPFLSEKTLNGLAERVRPEKLEELVELAPFLSEQALDKLVQRCTVSEDFDTITELAPFLS